MRAVNLIPAEQARAARRGGRSGGGAYVVLGMLAVLVALVAVWTHLGRTVQDKEAQAAAVRAAADAAEAKSGSLKAYTDFVALREKRTQTVRQLADSRFDWPHALREVARTMPTGVWLTSLRATVTPSVAVDGTPDPLRGSLAQPAVEVAACGRSQRDSIQTVAAMRSMDGVQRVSLSSSVRAGGSGGGDCGDAGKELVSFSLTVFFMAPPAQAPAPAPSATAATASASATTQGTTP
jgi:Tfp pilus assembly protein PilN